MFNQLKMLFITLLCGLVAGWVLSQFQVPAPYMLGSLFGAWWLGKQAFSFLPKLGVPRWFHVAVILGISTMMGAAFSPDMSENLVLWGGTVVAMLGATVLATMGGYLYLTRVRGYESPLALLCSLPGGQAEVVAISRDLVEKDYVVAFCHLVRVVVVVCLIPLLLVFSEGSAGVTASYVSLEKLPGVAELPLAIFLQYLGLSLGGFVLARWLRIPIPHLLGPLLVSSVAHLTGLVELPRVTEFIVLAQITIGGAVGARLSLVKTNELMGYFRDALVNTLIVISVYCLVAVSLAFFGGMELMELVLAFIPGGLYEVTVLALLFGFDVAFVAFHHTVRVLVIFLCLPVVGRFLGGGIR